MSKLNKGLLITTAVLTASLILTGCSTPSQSSASSNQTATASATDFFTTDTIHEISVDFDEADYQTMLTEYTNSGDKTWIKATVTIDGTTFKNVGIKLKGNSTLRGLSNSATKTESKTTNKTESTEATTTSTAEEKNVPTGEPSSLDSESPETLPWVIRLDKYEKDVAYKGRSYFVVRANNTETSLNEAVALAVLNEAGVEAEKAAFTKFSVNNSEEKLRLVLDVPDDDLWTEEHFDSTGLLYKADGNGDYSYRGTDPTDYVDVFEQKYGDDDLTPLISFLDFINNSTDEDFAAELDDYLDTDAFATYLASQELIHNTDDIDGPGNNSYLYYDATTKKMTVVAWDHNLAFGGMGMGGFAGGKMAGALGKNDGMTPADAGQTPPEGMENPPEGMGTPPEMDGSRPEMPDGEQFQGDDNEKTDRPAGGMGGMGGKENILVTRFLANDTFKDLYQTKLDSLTTSVIDNDFGASVLSDYQELLTKNVSDLVDSETIVSEAKSISDMLQSEPLLTSESK
ncbi:CotH kinase family protein [Vagococcus sp. BWB3-3]|uniref:CotH kinase family protein n=1 Tax=Vagococcus allomyrinae TaxID=2794353 RepID=A0A940SS76_9ENTE|nr:CotH kinase family protein [Vagococcus allomyrinae]MBP1041622.1 CotH kinase family protein [Vagococcus allomyrinae]